MVELEKSLTETLGTRVIIETNAEGGRLLIDFFSPEDLTTIAAALAAREAPIAQQVSANTTQLTDDPVVPPAPEESNDDELYSVSNFTV